MTPQEQLTAAIAAGLTFADCVKAFAGKHSPNEAKYVAAARDVWHKEGEIEIDDTTICSGSSGPGDYVLAWVWIDDETAGVETEEEEA